MDLFIIVDILMKDSYHLKDHPNHVRLLALEVLLLLITIMATPLKDPHLQNHVHKHHQKWVTVEAHLIIMTDSTSNLSPHPPSLNPWHQVHMVVHNRDNHNKVMIRHSYKLSQSSSKLTFCLIG